jgi:hypothetical protein
MTVLLSVAKMAIDSRDRPDISIYQDKDLLCSLLSSRSPKGYNQKQHE